MSHSIFEKIRGLWYATVHHTRKNNHFMFYMCGFSKYIMPDGLSRRALCGILKEFYHLPVSEQEYIQQRVDYYCKFSDSIFLPDDAPQLSRFSFKERESYVHDYVNSTYFFDAYEYVRYFPKRFRWAYNPGDVFYLFPLPEITKSRPITPDDGNRNNILLNLDKVRHFTWVYDPFTWEQKECRILFRGDVRNKPRRIKFMEMWQDNPLCDLANTGNMTLFDHLYYRYIMALEGNDVASNLKWVMSSNSVAVMPRPTCETWYMEGKLIPNYHYIEIASDYHDLIERIMYYEEHPEEVKAIVKHAHEWVAQFRNKKREKLISLMVLDKYFTLTGQRGAHKRKNRHYIVNDLVKLNASQKVNAQSKAREDVVHTLKNVGYKVCDIVNRKYSWGAYKPYHHYPFITKYVVNKQARRFVGRIKEGDTVFIQDFHLEHMQYIATECLMRKARVVFLVHDIQCIRYSIMTNEVEQLNNASVLLVHTQAMADKLRSIGVITPMRVMTLFDYYSSDPMQELNETLARKSEIVFAGNLSKSEFLKPLVRERSNKTVRFKLYGFLGDLKITGNRIFSYCGVFKPAKTGSIIGGWGLVWDGDSIDTCIGDYGDYLRYNSSHKTSLYLACGIPIIVWKHSSLADWVREEKVGIVVPNLRRICKRIEAVSDEEYRQMISNAQAIGKKLRSGEYLKTLLNEL